MKMFMHFLFQVFNTAINEISNYCIIFRPLGGIVMNQEKYIVSKVKKMIRFGFEYTWFLNEIGLK